MNFFYYFCIFKASNASFFMKHIGLFLSIAAAFLCLSVLAQQVVNVGNGSYASYPPLIKCRSVDHGGDQSMYMQTRPLFIREQAGRPLPTNDWWTDMIKESQPFSGHLWSYPQYVEAFQGGVSVSFLDYWISNGTEMKPTTSLKISGVDFAPGCAVVEDWHDWDVEFSLAKGGKRMLVTLAHGVPFTWVETSGINLRIDGTPLSAASDGAFVVSKQGYDDIGNALTALYGVYLPHDVNVVVGDGFTEARFASPAGYAVVALLNSADDLEAFRPYAYNVPRSTTVSWDYDATAGKVNTHWTIAAENLKGTGSNVKCLQGFLPHHYRDGAATAFGFTGHEYRTPHGMLRLAEGSSFDVSYDFAGMLPYYPAPTDTLAAEHPFLKSRMRQMIADYAAQGGFGDDTYWGGKGLTQMALYMMFAREMGDAELFRQCRDRLKAALVDWLTYTPGENNKFFARYDRWGALIGYDTSYDSETFNDHHFHYGYFTYAGALLCLVDDDFRTGYGAMLREVAKDYANWDRTDTRYPLFRTFDPWAGHSFAGGMGDGNGNGQESSSEAMQSWGGLYLLGMALGDTAMRDAGLFGYVSEARATAEYWFDRRSRRGDGTQNIDYTKFEHPYNSNLTCHGVGWWNYFSGDQLWNAAIQWMPISPCLDYLSEDLDFTRWDYETAWSLKSIGGWFERASHTENGNVIDDGSLGDASGLGNVVLSYLQRFDPQQAAAVFDQLYDSGASTARATDTGGITYFVTHSHLSHGDIAWDIHADMPSARAFRNADGTITYAAYNPFDEEKKVRFSDGHELLCQPRALTVSGQESHAVDEIVPVQTAVPDVRELLVMPNLALHKPVSVSGFENAGTVAANLTDGDATTRWGSLHKDGEWCSVDLQQPAKIYRLRLLWEAAYASEYQVLVSNDGEQWSLLDTRQCSGGEDIVPMGDITARHIKIIGTKRATQYGISLYEMEAYGQWADAADDELLGMRITADADVLKQHEAQPISVQGYTVGGAWVDLDGVEWTSSDGTVTAGGVFTPSVYPFASVTANYGGVSATATFPVEEALYTTSVSLTADAPYVLVDEPLALTLTASDQFGTKNTVENALISVYAVSGGALMPTTEAQIAGGSAVASRAGDFAAVAEYAGLKDTLYFAAKAFADINLALHKPVSATSENGGNKGICLTDGELQTRWESLWGAEYSEQWKDQQQITIDLRGVYMVNRVVITWEAAYAEQFKLLVSVDGEVWTEVRSAAGVNGAQELAFAETEARYVRIELGGRHLTAYGYSIYEIEVYGTSRVDATGLETPLDDVLPDPFASTEAFAMFRTAVGEPLVLYGADGKCVAINPSYEAIKSLPSGVYLLGGHKVMKR